MNTLFIGADGEQVVDSKETMVQIEQEHEYLKGFLDV
jgi:hypothetical protein